MTQYSYEMNKLSQSGSLSDTDYQVQLRTAFQNNEIETFEKVLNNLLTKHKMTTKEILENVYPHGYKTYLEIAVSEPERQEFVKLLLKHKVQINNINETQSGRAPIHFAVENGNIKALKLLLDDDRIDVNVKCKGQTALLMAINKIKELEDDRERDLEIYEDMVELLLKAGCNANSPDCKLITPISAAATQKLEKVITLIFNYSKNKIDLDTYKNWEEKTARDCLNEAFPALLTKFDNRIESIKNINDDILFSYLHSDNETEFISDFSKLVATNQHLIVLTANNGSYTMLQLSVQKGFHKVVKILLDAGANPNYTFSGNTCPPVEIACRKGFHNILKLFVEQKSSLDPFDVETLIQITVKGMGTQYNNSKANFKSCLELLLQQKNIEINHSDFKNNTALHYAARNGDNDTVLKLLRKGACIGIQNAFNEPPLADINAKTLETYLDECITTNDERSSDDDYEIHMKYNFLVYPNNSVENELHTSLMNTSNNNLKKQDVNLAPELDALLYMTRNEELRPLLKHPVITSFLYMKWKRICCLFYGNIIFYSLFWVSLILYIIFGNRLEKKQRDSIEILNIITHVGVIIGLIVLILRELFQLYVSRVKYFKCENMMEVALIFVTISIVFLDSVTKSDKQQLSSVAILLSSAELLLLIGHVPFLSSKIVMLKTVSLNFFKFMFSYCILIIAFALSFYTLFRQEAEEHQKAPNLNDTDKKKEQENISLEKDPSSSLFKTIVMLTGEFDAGSIKFYTFPVTSHLIFILFIFMIPIVLLNLLNGLAVGDTQAIRAEAELVGYISRIKLISYFESVLLGNATEYAKPFKFWSCLPLYLQDFHFIKPRALCITPFAKRITLFPHFIPRYKIIVKPNQDNRIEIPQEKNSRKYSDEDENIEKGQCCFECCTNYRLPEKIVKNAKIVISKKKKKTEFEEMKEFVQEEIKSVKDMMQNMLNLLERPANY